MRIRVGLAVAVMVLAVPLVACTDSKGAQDTAQPVVQPCPDDPAATTSVAFVPDVDLPTPVSADAADRATQLLLQSAEFGPCLRTGDAQVTDMVLWESASGKGKVGVVVSVTFAEPVDLPVTVRGWNPVGESQASPEDDLGRMITTEVPQVARSHVTVENVYVSFVGTPGVHAAAKLV